MSGVRQSKITKGMVLAGLGEKGLIDVVAVPIGCNVCTTDIEGIYC